MCGSICHRSRSASALFGQRGSVVAAADWYGNAEVDYLLQRLDSFEGTAVPTTNLETAIDLHLERVVRTEQRERQGHRLRSVRLSHSAARLSLL